MENTGWVTDGRRIWRAKVRPEWAEWGPEWRFAGYIEYPEEGELPARGFLDGGDIPVSPGNWFEDGEYLGPDTEGVEPVFWAEGIVPWW